MVADIGAVTLPLATAEKLYGGVALSAEEQAMVDRVPEVTRRLVAKIPRLDGVLEILDSYRFTPSPGDFAALDPIPAGALVLRIAADYDDLEFRGASETVALGTLGSRRIYDRWLLGQFAGVIGVGAGAPTIQEISLAELAVGMTLADDVRNTAGGLLVARGQPVTDQLIDRLDNLIAGTVRQPLRVFEAQSTSPAAA
jgi:hypothetical protein